MACLNVEVLYLRNPKIRQDVLSLKQWSEKQKDLPTSSDLLLFLCLNSTFYNIDKAKEKIRSYHNLRKAWPDVFKNRNPSKQPFRAQLNLAVVWLLNYTTPDGYKILFIKLVESDASIYDLEGQMKLVFLVLDYWTRLKGDSEFVMLIDHTGFTWRHLPKYRLAIIKKYITYAQEGLPLVLKQVHLINLSSLTKTLFKISKIFMNKETYDLLHFHHNLESLYNYIPQQCLPKDLGGNDVSTADLHNNMMETILANSDLFTKEDEGSSELYG